MPPSTLDPALGPAKPRRAATARPAAGWQTAMPWTDAAGRFSWLKLAVLLLLCWPGLEIAVDLASGALGARPLNEAVHRIGNWSLRFILLALAVTPGRVLFDWPRAMQLRRMIGVAAFVYVAAHLLLYIADEAFDLAKVAGEVALRFYLTIGFVSLLILLALTITSTDGMTRRLGGRRWKRLHRWVYLAGLLSVIHFFLQTKADVDEPWVMAGIFFWLMAWRPASFIAKKRGKKLTWYFPTLLALAATLATALGEAAYYWIKLGVAPLMVLAPNLTFDLGWRPAMVVAAITLAVAAVGVLRAFQRRAGTPSPAA